MAREAQRIEDDASGRAGPPDGVAPPRDDLARQEDVTGGSATAAATGEPPTPDGVLPDPAETGRALALCVAEILSGAREVDSIARWISEDVQRHLQQRAAFAARARSATGRRRRRPSIRVGSVVVCRPRDGVAEVSAVVHTRSHARAVAIRLEERSGRWRATAIAML